MRRILVIVALAWITGCAAPMQRSIVRQTAAPATRVVAATTRSTDPASLRFAEIGPRLRLSTTRPATTRAATGPAPLEALELYGKARDAMLQNQRYTAIALLEKAIQIDPTSYAPRRDLGQAYAGGSGAANDQSIKAYEAAAALEPDHLDLQTEIGRQYLTRSKTDKAIEHLRLALQTRDYRRDDPLSAVAEYYLGRALQTRGYEQASIDIFERLFKRLQRGGVPARLTPELSYLVNQPESVAARLAELHEKRGNYAEALVALTFVAEQHPEMFDVHARIARLLLQAGRPDDAARRATEAVRTFKASNESLDLLKDIYRQHGGDAAVADQLLRLHGEKPADRAVLYALVDVLSGSNRSQEAQQLLVQAAQRNNYDPQTVRQLYRLYDARNDTDAATRLIISALAHRPDSIRDLDEIWQQVLSSSKRNRLTIARLNGLGVSPEAQASKLLWLSRLAQRWDREILARTSLEQSVKLTPAFAPSHRILVVDYATRSDWDAARQAHETRTLIDSVRSQGQNGLAIELEGLVLLAQNKAAEAARKFAQAMKIGNNSIDVRLSHATALRQAGDHTSAEKTLWKLVADEPNCEDAYGALFRGYIEAGSGDQAMPVLKQWLTNNPNSVNAKVVQAAVLLQARQQDQAEKILLDLFERQPDSADVLIAVLEYYKRVGKIDDYIAKLEAERSNHPENRTAIEQLVQIYAQQKHMPEATRVLDAARGAVGEDNDLLYYVGALYARIGQRATQEKILLEIVQKDPAYAPASNDLGYTWADRGENLVRAEELIRNAVKSEPDNQSYLDSLGWVLYKRGKFDEARKFLDEAIAPATLPDPVVLDHLGDVLYRLGHRDEAIKNWKRSQQRLKQTVSERDDLKQLQLQLQQKLKQAEANQPVTVAPTVEASIASPPRK